MNNARRVVLGAGSTAAALLWFPTATGPRDRQELASKMTEYDVQEDNKRIQSNLKDVLLENVLWSVAHGEAGQNPVMEKLDVRVGNRRETWNELVQRAGKKDQVDVLIIGGGATGTGCALDAATRYVVTNKRVLARDVVFCGVLFERGHGRV